MKSKVVWGLLVVVLCCSCFLTGCSVKDDQKNLDNKDDVISDGGNNNDALAVDSDIIKELYDYIPAYDNLSYEFTAYRNSIVTVDDIDNGYLLSVVVRKLNISDNDKVPYKNGYDSVDDFDSSDWYGFDASILQSQVKKMYGKNLENQSFSINWYERYYFDAKDNKYYRSHVLGGNENFVRSIRRIDSAYLVGNDIIIEDKYMLLYYGTDPYGFILYASSDRDDKITDLDENLYGQHLLDTVLENEYCDSMRKYKHVFKKGSNGEYYWFSTEPIAN